ncbi:hypothetical protein LL912_12195 [Niabella sp. CC-SYL272]|uniref:hypothetical protein n=1 Tax=Niabella agricola TaxID=2891571 RepID=UPI001F173B86|nr:hypothetical protein [Niabella agricola]MCF3109534.1 hypothetical protein [Niabella agricola]
MVHQKQWSPGKGRQLEWVWEMYHVTVPVFVREADPLKKIEIECGNQGKKTFVSIINSGFKGDMDQQMAAIRDPTEGFALVLAGLKVLLEHGIQLNLVNDRFPGGI